MPVIYAKNNDGHPHHPLYLRKDAEMKEFDIERYLKKMSNIFK